ncbi:cation diffusion facilitator family transporter [Alkaliphilus hydrothermalis]|uniref:Cation diffusion facilitator family transporter n=1 Tax=Alkaliphilus hydrothermalis TaxID=1482730 RepID=A0ABS2NPI2_9FIRM|nr:cation diffusion facilitator family transporter [Alkaliphilus hydrothermalis]MBM7614831.1 cation diffusion facilitator family transporter [Alkaliphilus hydrothermalis]
MDDQQRYKEVKKVSIISMIVNILLTIVKGLIGFTAGSTALIADAFHSASDLFTTVVLLQGLKIAHRPADENHPYGHYKAEQVTSKIIALTLIVTALGIGNEAYQVLRSGEVNPPATTAIYAVILSLIGKEAMYRYTIKVGRRIKSNAVIADAWHQRSDAFSSVATLVGIGGALLGYPLMDPLAGIFVSFLILKTGITIYMDAIRDLMDTAPKPEIVEGIKKSASAAEGVKEVQDVKVRSYGSKYLVDMKICVNPKITVEEGHGAAARAKENIIKENDDILDVLIHVNPCFPTKPHSHDAGNKDQ